MNTLVTRLIACLIVVAGASTAVGCGDSVANQGNLGNLVYTLFTQYEIEESELSAVSLITGVQHRIVVTQAPGADIKQRSTIQHVLFPAGDTEITTDTPTDDSSVGDALLTINIPGKYTLQSWKDTELVDYIVLNFVQASDLRVVIFLKTPESQEFAHAAGDFLTVPLWTQATFLAAPVDADDNDLVGDIGLEVSTEPQDSLIRLSNLISVTEMDVWESAYPINMLFVETGTIQVTFTEPLTGLSKMLTFNVTADYVPPDE